MTTLLIVYLQSKRSRYKPVRLRSGHRVKSPLGAKSAAAPSRSHAHFIVVRG